LSAACLQLLNPEMADTITLNRSVETASNACYAQHSWPLRVVATSNKDNLSSKIFVWQENAPNSGYAGDRFSVVASTQQMVDLPEDGPVDEGDEHIPFYRKDELVLDCRSPELRQEIWDKIQADVLDLLGNWIALENTEEVETVVIALT